jgi:hypothetical protein
VIHTDGGGALWGSTSFCQYLLEETQKVIIETTHRENSAANGTPEQDIGQVILQTQLLLYGSALEAADWSFSILYATLLLNM